ncbi:MAG: DUF4838 domain-containing protein [Candidatus Hydrogenedentes bacterium]|nr:DUF4838 domain-containing protein [Candidatus Hydrogenedentota bacterium]
MWNTQGVSQRRFLNSSLRGTAAAIGGLVFSNRMAQAAPATLCIVSQEGAQPPELRAAKELQHYLTQAMGRVVPIVQSLPENGAAIVVGRGPVAAGLGVNPTDAELGAQGCVLRRAGEHLVIAGTPGSGTLLGTYDFLEDHLGVRWYAPGITHTPERPDFALPAIDQVNQPNFLWRHTSYWADADREFTAHQRDNAFRRDASPDFGELIAHNARAHSYFRYITPEEFFDTHPEYFSEIGGVRRREETQLCLSNPDVLEIVTERILQQMTGHPEFHQHNFSQMDYYNYCQCARCTERNQELGATGGTQFWFVNELAKRTAPLHPGKLIGTLAYTYSEVPPAGMEMHPNAAIWLCHMFPSCDSHPIASCSMNARFKERAQTWSTRCKHLYIWHYIVDFAHYYVPFPNFRAMAADLRFYRDIGVEGVYLQAMGHKGGGGEFSLLRGYYGMQLLRNPDRDPDAIIDDFLQGYYGAAAPAIRAYITLLHDKVEHEDIHMHLYTNPAQGYLDDGVIVASNALFDRAEAAVASDEELLERVRVARMPLIYAKAFPRNGYTIHEDHLAFGGLRATPAEVQEFLERMKRHGFETIREHNGDPAMMHLMSGLLASPVPLQVMENTFLRVEAVPLFGGRMLRLIHKPTGTCVTTHNRKQGLFFPFNGGEENRIGGIYSGLANFNLFAVVESSPTHMVLEVKQPDGFKVRRTMRLLDDAPEVECTTTVTNTAATPQELVLRSHLELDLGPVEGVRVQFTEQSGAEAGMDMEPVVAGGREGLHFHDTHLPQGGWTFTGANNLPVEQRFDGQEIDGTWLVSFPNRMNTIEVELWRKPVQLVPGAEAALSHRLRVGPKA